MKVLIIGINYAPEMVGIGPYTAGMAQFLSQLGHSVTVVCAKPYYPQWKVDPAYASHGWHVNEEHGVRVVRVPTYIPSRPNGLRRLAHHMSFATTAQLAVGIETRRSKPDVIIGVAPSLISMTVARRAAQRTGAKLWLHIQDFEVEAAFATGLLKDKGLLADAARRFERWAIRADRVSTISPQMCDKLIEKGVPHNRVIQFRNWANVEEVVPLSGPSKYRAEWGIDQKNIAVYSGNIANKQGIEIILEAAHLLNYRKDIVFVICGNGPNKINLIERSAGINNIHFFDLQPRELLSELLGMATIHLLPQIAEAADLVLPSKLTNMLASGRPIVATASPGTGLAEELEGCGIISQPGNPADFANAILALIDDQKLIRVASENARLRAVERWSKDVILPQFASDLKRMLEDDC